MNQEDRFCLFDGAMGHDQDGLLTGLLEYLAVGYDRTENGEERCAEGLESAMTGVCGWSS